MNSIKIKNIVCLLIIFHLTIFLPLNANALKFKRITSIKTSNTATEAILSHNKELVIINFGNRVRKIKYKNQKIQVLFEKDFKYPITSACLDKNNKIWVGDFEGALYAMSWDGNYISKFLKENHSSISIITPYDKNIILIAGMDKYLYILKIKERELYKMALPVEDMKVEAIKAIDVNSNGLIAFAGCQHYHKVFPDSNMLECDKSIVGLISQIGSEKSISILGTFDELIQCITFNQKGNKLAVGGKDGYLGIWNVNKKSLIQLLHLPSIANTIFDVKFSDDGRYLLVGGYYLYLFDPKTGKLLAYDRTLFDELNRIWKVAFLDSENYIVAGGEGKVTILKIVP